MTSKDNIPVKFGSTEQQLDHTRAPQAGRSSGGKKSAFTPGERRKCTDTLFLIVFILFWFGMISIGIYAFANSNTDALLYKRDYMGNACKGNKIGDITGYKGKKLYLYQSTEKKVAGICCEACPKSGDTVTDHNPGNKLTQIAILSTYDFYGVCVPAEHEMKSSGFVSLLGYADDLEKYTTTIRRMFSDVYEGATGIFIIGGVATFFICLLWLLLMSQCAEIFIWASILIFFAVFASGTYVTGCRGYEWSSCANSAVPVPTVSPPGYSDQSNTLKAYKGAFWIFAVITGLIFFATICLFKQIRLAGAILSEVSKALMAMFSLTVFPVIPFFMMMVLYGWWTAVSIALYGLESDKTTDPTIVNGQSVQVTDSLSTTNTSNLWWFHFFGLLWTTQVIEGIALTTIAGSFCAWYWRDDKTALGHTPIMSAFYRTVRFHLGTTMLGGLIVAIVQFIRSVLTYLQAKLKEQGQNNSIVKLVFCALQCCFWCLECCLKYLNKQAYIMTAMKGTSFFNSAFHGLGLLFKNSKRVAALNMASGFVVAISKNAIIALSALISYQWIDSMDDVNNAIAPTVVSVALAYGVTYVVLSIYDFGCDTILLCVLEDEDINKSTKQFYASPNIIKLLK